MGKSDSLKLKEKKEKGIASARRACLKLTPKHIDGKLIGSKRFVRPAMINALVTKDKRYFLYPYPDLLADEASVMIDGAPALEIFNEKKDDEK